MKGLCLGSPGKRGRGRGPGPPHDHHEDHRSDDDEEGEEGDDHREKFHAAKTIEVEGPRQAARETGG